ncbi:MAG: hypothetical protein HRT98_03290 [Mycoplasmatales bacterium]|nr:hypothetical protein [Mycoplasmatales bacterium]
MEPNLESMNNIKVSCHDKGYSVDSNNSWPTFSRLNHSTLRTFDTIYYPKGNVINFDTLYEVEVFLATVRRIIGI